MNDERYFVYKLIPPRPTFDKDMSGGERAIMADHAAYWRDLVDRGSVLGFGPLTAPSGVSGLAIVTAEGQQEVHDIAGRDPAVSSGMATFEIGTMLSAVTAPQR